MVRLQAAASAMLEIPPEQSSVLSGSTARTDMLYFHVKGSAKRVLHSYGSWRQRLSDCTAMGCSTGLDTDRSRSRPVSSACATGPQKIAPIDSYTTTRSSGSVVSRCVSGTGVRSLMDGSKSSGGERSTDDKSRFNLSGAVLATDGDDVDSEPRGAIHIILGPMFAGKTTALLRKVQAEIDSGRSVEKLSTQAIVSSIPLYGFIRMMS